MHQPTPSCRLFSVARVPSAGALARWVSVAGAVAVCALAGCGGVLAGVQRSSGAPTGSHPGGAPSPLSAVRLAARAALAQSTGARLRLEGASALGASSAPVLGSGEFDFTAGTGREAIDLGETGHREPGNEQLVLLPDRAYLQPKAPSRTVLPKGRQWMAAPLTGSDSVTTNFPSFVLQVEGVDPELLLAELAGGTVAAMPAGEHPVEGVPARAYDATVDLTRALGALNAERSLGGPAAPALGQAIQSELSALAGEGAVGERRASGGVPGEGATGGQRVYVRAWVDGAGQVVGLRAVLPGSGLGLETITLCCFGQPVEAQPPPAARVVGIESLTPSGERENNGGGDSDGG